MVEERDESRDRSLEVDVVLPECIVRIDEKVLCSVVHLSSHYNIITFVLSESTVVESCAENALLEFQG
jgi:hypothetical protein